MGKKRIAIIGAGASGMIAAITAARLGAHVTIFERNDRVGKKLLATGNGQCNLTNLNCRQDHYHGENAHFVNEVFKQFSVQDTIAFFNSLGVLTIFEDDGKVYPRTLQASTILDVLRFELEHTGVNIKTQTAVTSFRKSKSGFTLKSEEEQFTSDILIVACGSRAAPQLGGNNSGVEILATSGHTSTTLYPVLVPVKTDYHFNRHLKGTKVKAKISIEINNSIFAHEEGELLFTDYGLSGPPVIQLSIPINRALLQKKKVRCNVDLFPEMTVNELTEHLHKRFESKSGMHIETALIGFVNKRLISSLTADCGIASPTVKSGNLGSDDVTRIAQIAKKWSFDITGSLSWNDAHVCAGGIRTSEFNATTMESRIVKGLYATGEVLDITGDCGGYNLQWAWSSGYVAGKSAVGEKV